VNLFRTLLWWLLLAALGALAWDLLSVDVGDVVVRWHGHTLTTTVAFLLIAWGLLWFALWALWALLRLPFTAWHRLAYTQARNRLTNGLIALHEGRHARAGSLLEKAAEDSSMATVARLAAREAALRRGDLLAAAMQQGALAKDDPMAAMLNTAEALLAQGKPQLALDLLQPWAEKKQLPPRGLQMRGAALIGVGRASEAVTLLASLVNEQNLSAEQSSALERSWQAAALLQSAHANDLHQRWNQLPPRLREQEDLLLAYAMRAGQLGLEAEAANTLADAIDQQWNEALVRQFALLPPAREDQRLARAQAWLGDHPTSPALTLCLGRLCRGAQLQGKAEEMLHRAIAQGAGAEAWEELGNVHTAQRDADRAQACYLNALRSQRGESVRSLEGRSLREQIADEAVAEQRDEHGMPRLRS
jgi:HemY protein